MVIVGTVLAFTIFGRNAFGTGAFEMVMVTLGVLTLGFAIAALIVEPMWALLVPAMAWYSYGPGPSCTRQAASRGNTLPGPGKPRRAVGPA